jgi:hypothetical protein
MNSIRFGCTLSIAALLFCVSAPAVATPPTAQQLAGIYRTSVDRQLQIPGEELRRYSELVDLAFARAAIRIEGAQYVLAVDRDPQVQALLLLWRSEAGDYEIVGASAVSTGAPGSFDHFETPLGVFEHGPWNPDFRAEGTFNENGIRGYGLRGLRVFDFGWQRVPKGWGDHAVIDMRLQMHATEPDSLEARLGSPQSKGCIRIPTTLNRLLDHYGVLDAEYEKLAREGRQLWVLKQDREVVAGAGRYLVVVDSARQERPAWSPAPALPH